MSTILLAKELGGKPVLLDDYRARKLAKRQGLENQTTLLDTAKSKAGGRGPGPCVLRTSA